MTATMSSQIYARVERGGERYYVIDSIEMPSVTTILKSLSHDSISKWKKRVGESEANSICTIASERGTIVHEMCEQYLKCKYNTNVKTTGISNEHESTLPDILPHLNPSYVDVCIRQNLCDYFNISFVPLLLRIQNVQHQEATLYSHTHMYAGTVDCIAEFDGIMSIIDFKTSQKPKCKKYITSYFLQTAAYAIAYKEMTGIEIRTLQILIGILSTRSYQVFTEDLYNVCTSTGKTWHDSFLDMRTNFRERAH